MVQQIRTSDTLPPSADQLQCDRDCNEPATLAYRWEWGAAGVCCAQHAALLQQTSQSLSRAVVIHPIAQAAPAPLLRDERIQLTARAMVLEDEVRAHESKCSEQHRKIGDLQLQLNAAVVKARECEAQTRDAVAKVQMAEENASRLSSENGRLLVELERLRELESVVAERHGERGLESEPLTTVDG